VLFWESIDLLNCNYFIVVEIITYALCNNQRKRSLTLDKPNAEKSIVFSIVCIVLLKRWLYFALRTKESESARIGQLANWQRSPRYHGDFSILKRASSSSLRENCRLVIARVVTSFGQYQRHVDSFLPSSVFCYRILFLCSIGTFNEHLLENGCFPRAGKLHLVRNKTVYC
jgi:hypothetical protein